MLAIQRNLSNLFYAILSLPSTAMGFALSVQIAALSWMLSTQYGLAIEEVGLVWAAGPIAGIFGQIIFGVVSDRVWFWGGRRRPFILIGGLLASLTLLALPNIDRIAAALGTEGLLGVAILVALTLDLSINVGFNPTRSIIADVTPFGEARTKGYTWMQTISGSFGVLAYVIGAVFDNYVLIYAGAVLVFLLSVVPALFITEPRELSEPEADPEANTLAYGFRDIMLSILPLWGFLAYAIYGMAARILGLPAPGTALTVFFLLLVLLMVGITLFRSEKGKSTFERGRIGFQKVLAAHSFTWVGVQTMFIYTYAFLQERLPALTDLELGRTVSIAFLVLNAVAAVLPAFLLEPLARRLGKVKVHLGCMILMALGYAGLWSTGVSQLSVYFWMGIVGIGWAATVSLPFAIMSQKVDQRRMGLYMGLFNLSVVLPQLVASLGIGEYLADVASKGMVFLICTLCLALSALSWAMVKE